MYAPKLTLDALYGTAPLYSARASDRRCRWLVSDEVVRDALAGGLLPMAGELAMLCSRSSLTPRCRELLGRAGLAPGGPVELFDGPEDYARALRDLSRERRVVVHYRHAPEELPDERYWIPAALLDALSDKARLAEWVPAERLARRTVVSAAALAAGAPLPLPVVVKTAGDAPSAGGYGVRICHSEGAVIGAARAFADVPAVVVEEQLAFERNLCLHYGVDRAGTITFLAGAEQVIGADGRHGGNWLESARPVPKDAVDTGLAVCAAAWRRGYHGLAGIDVLVLGDGSHRVVDLNFRVNASSGPALLWESIQRRLGPLVARSLRFRLAEGLRAGRPRLASWIDAGRLLPLALCDTDQGIWHGRPAWMHALVLGESRSDVGAWLRSVGLPDRQA